MDGTTSHIPGIATPGSVLAECLAASTLDDMLRSAPSHLRIVVPTAAYRHVLQRAWARLRPGSQLPLISTMQQVVMTSVKQATPTVHLATDAEASAVLDLALADAGEVFRPPGCSLTNIIRWKQEGVTLATLMDMLSGTEDLAASDADDLRRIVRVWAAYEARMDDVAIDRGGMYTLPMVFDPVPTLVFATHGLSATDERYWYSAAEAGGDIAIHFAPRVGTVPDDRSAAVATRLTARGWMPAVPKTTPAAPVVLAHADTPRDEVRSILAAIKTLVQQGVHPTTIALAIPTRTVYDSLLRDEAMMAGVPLSRDLDLPLASTTDASALYAACCVVMHGWQRHDVARFVHVCRRTTQVDLSILSEAASLYRIEGGSGSSSWKRRLQDRRDALRQLLSTPISDDELMDDVEGIRRELQTVQRALSALDELEDLLTFPEGNVDASRLRSFLEHVADRCTITMQNDVCDTIIQYERFCALHAPAKEPMDVHVQRWWSFVRAQTRVVASGVARGVAVLSGSDMRMRDWQVVFAPGFVHGIRPPRQIDPVDRVVLGELSSTRQREGIVDLLAAASPTGCTILSRPMTMDGDETLASLYWDDIADDIASGLIPAGTEHPAARIMQEMTANPLFLHAAERRAYTGTPLLDRISRQLGIQMEDADEETQQKVRDQCAKPLSPSRIDRAAGCGYQYFAERLLQLQPSESVDEMLTNLERGHLMHAIAHRLFRQLQASPLPVDEFHGQDIVAAMVHLDAHSDEDLLETLHAIFHEERKRLPEHYLYRTAEDQAFSDHGERAGILRRWLAMERAQQAGEHPFFPILFELTIEDDVVLPDGRTEHVRLRIDRVDARRIVEEGQERYEVRVIDYKTSAHPTKGELLEGRKVQMPLYMLAVEQWFAQRGCAVRAVDAAYHLFGKSLFTDKAPKSKVVMVQQGDRGKGGKFPLHIDDVFPAVYHGIDTIREHQFRVAPAKGACDTCAHAEVCRIDDWGAAHAARNV